MTTEQNAQTPAAETTPPSSTPTPEAKTPAAESPPAKTPEQLEAEKKTPPDSGSQGTDLGADEKKPEGEKPAATTDLGAEDPPAELNADGTPKAKTEEPKTNEFHGFPETGEFEVTVPDGFVADDALKAEFAPIAKDLDLSPKGVQKLVDMKAKMDQQAVQRWGDHLVSLRDQAKKDPEIGGAKYDTSVQLAKQTIGKFGTPAFRKMLNDYGVGAHPEMIRYMSNVARAVGETPVLPSGEGAGAVPKALHDILYKDTPT